MGGSPVPLIPCDWQLDQSRRHRRNGRRRDPRMPGSMTPDFGYESMSLPSSSACVIRVDDEARLKKYYEKAFDSFQQLNCRVIAKAFIKLVEPRKQVNYPYNGRRASSSPGGERRADPEMTKPPWWPAGVTHKEPDHLLKPGMLFVLEIHMIGSVLTEPRAYPASHSHSSRTWQKPRCHLRETSRCRPRCASIYQPSRETSNSR